MAEAAGLAIGLVGIFNNVLDCFNYVHIGRNFGKRYQTCLLKLDSARLRLSRWGAAVGIVGDMDHLASLQSTKIPDQEVDHAEKILGQILVLFDNIQKESAKLRPKDESNQHVHDDATDLDPVTASLHLKMVHLSKSRQRTTNPWQKAKWALYSEKHFNELVDNITSLTGQLIELFPESRERQQQLCTSEIFEFTEPLRVLSAAAKGQDDTLENALLVFLDPAVSNTVCARHAGRMLTDRQNETFDWHNYNSKVGNQIGKNTGAITQTFA